jgi:ketosteroid isomerase-like protein
MSEENVEIVRAAVDALNRGDFDAAFTAMAPDCEFDMSRAIGPAAGVRSVDQERLLLEEFVRSWESFRFGVDDFIDGGDHVVIPFTNRVVGRDGIELQYRSTWVWTFREGAVVRACLYQERKEALEAAGLRE